MMTGFTTLFSKKYKELFHKLPDVEELNDVLAEKAIRIQPYMIFFDNKRNEPTKILASYWIPEQEIIVKLDWESKSYVTLYSKQDLK